jgi:hypothetical protein
MHGLGDRQAAGEHTTVTGGELARVQHNRRDLDLRDTKLDPAA